MRTIIEYLDAAIERQELGSDRQLSRLFGHTGNTVSQFRTGKSLPSPETMVKLARLAGLDEQVALVELAFMSSGGEARTAYEKILKRISTFLPATLFGLAAFHPDTAHAAEIVTKSIASTLGTNVLPRVESVSGIVTLLYITEKDNKLAFNKAAQKQHLNYHVLKCVSERKILPNQGGKKCLI